ncbi:putative AP2 protein [Hordeum vulgare]|nr:putative AP2 protein [Hordeum vulgare]
MIAPAKEKAGGRALHLARRFWRANKMLRLPRCFPSPSPSSAACSPLCRFPAAASVAPPPMHPHQATMPPRRCGSSGYRGVREHPSRAYYAEIRSGDVRLNLGTFETSHEATRAYDAVAWRLGRPHA